MSDTATLSAKSQISIPKAIRELRNWQAGQRFALVPRGSGVVLVPIPDIGELSGMARGAEATDVCERDDRY
jgi:AbrB family looped-hinge helix DNA binding protein